MQVPGTQMHILTFGFVCIETVILFYLILHGLARPKDKVTLLNCILIGLLIIYNVTGGLLPDLKLPGSFFIQNCIAYATGFITPCYFPYYVYHVFGLAKMKFHANRGVYYFLIVPYIIFVIVFAISGDLDEAKNLLVLPVAYALWVVYSLLQSVRYNDLKEVPRKESREEITIMFFGITPWVGLPVIDYFNLGQVVEVSITNTGFLLLFVLHLRKNVRILKLEHHRLINSEQLLLDWNERLQQEVDKRTMELETMSSEVRFNENCERYHLTKREKEISKLIHKGYTQRSIGEVLFISERTVAKHVQNIFEKTKVSNKIELLHKLGL